VSAKQQARALGYLGKEGAQGAEPPNARRGGEVSGTRAFVKPALFAGSLDNVAAQEEIFGPVAYLAFRTRSGDQDGPTPPTRSCQQRVDERSHARSAWRQIDVAGNSWINAQRLPHGVYGGINKSGMGGGVEAVPRRCSTTGAASPVVGASITRLHCPRRLLPGLGKLLSEAWRW
jgi:aldehyde dehydrogenase (NAD+)